MNVIALVAVITTLVVLSSGQQLTIRNNCRGTILVKSEAVNANSFFLNMGQSRTVSINRNSRVTPRVWAHAGCDKSGRNCDTTEGYVSLAEMFWDKNGKTWYDVSHVDGFSLPITIKPYNPAAGGKCQTTNCQFNINRNCPAQSKVFKGGRAVACKNLDRDRVTPYSRALKSSCPRVYSWSKDDRAGMRDCHRGNNGLHVIFC